MSDRLELKHDGWMVVADGRKALFLRNEGDEKFPNLEVFREEEQVNPPTREQGTGRPGRFSELVLVAAPPVLGEMRKELHKEVSDRIIGEVDKDLTNHPVHEIEVLILRRAG